MEIFMSPQNFWKSLECKYASKPRVFGVWKGWSPSTLLYKVPYSLFLIFWKFGSKKKQTEFIFLLLGNLRGWGQDSCNCTLYLSLHCLPLAS